MITALEILAIVVCAALSIASLCGGALILQFTVERFLLNTLPLLAELYGRIRYPRDYKE